MELHEKLKMLRKSEGLTQRKVADYREIDVSTYAHYEDGRRTPNKDKLKMLADIYKLKDEML